MMRLDCAAVGSDLSQAVGTAALRFCAFGARSRAKGTLRKGAKNSPSMSGWTCQIKYLCLCFLSCPLFTVTRAGVLVHRVEPHLGLSISPQFSRTRPPQAIFAVGLRV